MSRFVNVAAFVDPSKAEIARAALADAGIATRVADGEAVIAEWLPADAPGGIALQVNDSDADRAADLLAMRGMGTYLVGDRISDEELERQALAEEAEGE